MCTFGAKHGHDPQASLTDVVQSPRSTLRFASHKTIGLAVVRVLDEADLALLVRARLRTVNVLPLPRGYQRHHPGGSDDVGLIEDTAGLVTVTMRPMLTDAELCAEHVEEANKNAREVA